MALLPQDPQKQKLVLAGLRPVLLAFGYYYFYHTKRVTEADALQANVDRLEASNAGMRQIVGRFGQDFQQRLAIYQAHVEQLEQLIPRREDVPVLEASVGAFTRLWLGARPATGASGRPGELAGQIVWPLRRWRDVARRCWGVNRRKILGLLHDVCSNVDGDVDRAHGKSGTAASGPLE